MENDQTDLLDSTERLGGWESERCRTEGFSRIFLRFDDFGVVSVVAEAGKKLGL